MADSGSTNIERGKVLGAEFFRYFLVSLIALAVDFGTLVGLTELLGVPYLLSNAVSFVLGATVVYVGGILWVFRRRRMADRRAEYFVFVAIGIGGLAVNEGVLWLFTSTAGLHYTLSKAVAAAASFMFNFIVRKVTLFR